MSDRSTMIQSDLEAVLLTVVHGLAAADGYRFMLDGWYAREIDAIAMLDVLVAEEGCVPVGIVHRRDKSFGVAYLADRTIFDNHELPEWIELLVANHFATTA